MNWGEPTVIAALAAAAGVLLAEARGFLFGSRQQKADLADIEQRIAEGLLSRLDKRLLEAEQRIATLEREIHQVRTDRDMLRQQLAVVTAERDALFAERITLLDRISILSPPGQ